jgi:periplasmic divalent cation tolerance protein
VKTETSASDLLAVLTSVSTEKQALDIAQALVQRRLAACVNVLPVARSIFRWKGRVQQDSEFLLLIKTLEVNFEAVRVAIKELNAYELPEIIGIPASKADAAFAAWVTESSSGVPSDDDEDDESGEATID